MSIESKILTYLINNRDRWVSKIELEDKRRFFKCMAETVGRKARSLYKKHSLIRKRYIDNIVEYKYEI